MAALYPFIRPLIFKSSAETSHNVAKYALRTMQKSDLVRSSLRSVYRYEHPALAVDAFGLTFDNPLCVAAGFDKNGEITAILPDLGFGGVEVGSVTPEPQQGNPRPRLFRLPEDAGLIDYMGLPNHGAKRVRANLASTGVSDGTPVGIVLEKMNDSTAEDSVRDYRRVLETLYEYGDYFVVGFCPNTPDEFDKTKIEYMEHIFREVAAANPEGKPVLVKVGNTYMERSEVQAIVELTEEFGFDGFIVNGSLKDKSSVESPNKHRLPNGAVHGGPIRDRALRTTMETSKLTDLPIIGVGGIDSAESAYQRIRAGASLLQLYTHFVYRGPTTARQINSGLVERLQADGFDSIEAAVGTAVDDDEQSIP